VLIDLVQIGLLPVRVRLVIIDLPNLALGIHLILLHLWRPTRDEVVHLSESVLQLMRFVYRVHHPLLDIVVFLLNLVNLLLNRKLQLISVLILLALILW